MYDRKSRIIRAKRMIKTLEDYIGKGKLSELSLLEVGSSTGIICNELAKRFKKVVGIDIDKDGVKYAKKKYKRRNLTFKIGDAMNTGFKNDVFDVVVCAQVYEHVPDDVKLMSEIHRILKPGGVCYFAALNRLWPIEPHHNLLFLSWLPKSVGNPYVKLFCKADEYYENLRTPWNLEKLCRDFEIVKYTSKILRNPKIFGYEDRFDSTIKRFLAKVWAPFSEYTAPTLFWILEKKKC